MSKIHLEIEIPGNAKTYEFVLDDRMKIGTAKEQIKKQSSRPSSPCTGCASSRLDR